MLLHAFTEFCRFAGMDWNNHIELLIGAGATPALIAQRIGVTPNAIREIRAGRTKAPRAAAAFELAKLTPADFAGQAAEENRVEPRHEIATQIDTRMSKRALRARLGFTTDKQLAAVLRLPIDQVESWEEERALPAVPEVLRLLGVQPAVQAEQVPADPDDDRIVPVESA
jgi:transcriptional regulator with XRE-family HTH domain